MAIYSVHYAVCDGCGDHDDDSRPTIEEAEARMYQHETRPGIFCDTCMGWEDDDA